MFGQWTRQIDGFTQTVEFVVHEDGTALIKTEHLQLLLLEAGFRP